MATVLISAMATRNRGLLICCISLFVATSISILPFVVIAADNQALVSPTITSISPASPIAINKKQRFVIRGNNFHRNATVTLRDLRTGEVFENRHVIDRSSHRLELNVFFTSTPSTWSVEVTNPGNASSEAYQFTVVRDNEADAHIRSETLHESKAATKAITRLGWYHPIGHDAAITSSWLDGSDLKNTHIDDKVVSTSSYIPGRVHLGTDFRAVVDAPVYAISDGEVIKIYASGDCVAIRHKTKRGDFVAIYAHIAPSVKVGQTVKPGQEVARIAPYAKGSHLHFGIAWGPSPPDVVEGRYGWGRASVEYFHKHGIPNGLIDPIAWLNTHAPE